MKKLIQVIATSVMAIPIVISGFVYDALFAGIPYQEPTLELQARYDFHSAVAGLFYQGGGIVLLLGLLATPIILKKTKPTRECRVLWRSAAKPDGNCWINLSQ